jgi:hypothetical protein
LLTITILSMSHGMMGSAPGGLGYLTEVFEEARLSSHLEDRTAPDFWLPKSLAYLKKRYPGRIRTRWINPHTPYGMLVVMRYHIRSYPTLFIDGQMMGPLGGRKEFEDSIAKALSAVDGTDPREDGGIPVEESPEKIGWLQRIKNAFGDYIYGMAAHEGTRFALKTRGSMEHLFILITMGDLLGVPILPPYYSLRLLPYVVPQIATWKRRMLREKDLTDALA